MIRFQYFESTVYRKNYRVPPLRVLMNIPPLRVPNTAIVFFSIHRMCKPLPIRY